MVIQKDYLLVMRMDLTKEKLLEYVLKLLVRLWDALMVKMLGCLMVKLKDIVMDFEWEKMLVYLMDLCLVIMRDC